MKKEKFHVEYVFDTVSQRSLWNHITTPPGLSSWFADDVAINDTIYTFTWDKSSEKAEVILFKPDTVVRYRWINKEEDCKDIYFEFRIHYIELTNSISLEITDFTEPSERKDAIDLWDFQEAN